MSLKLAKFIMQSNVLKHVTIKYDKTDERFYFPVKSLCFSQTIHTAINNIQHKNVL